MLNDIAYHDQLIAQVMLNLFDALQAGAPNLYAQACCELLAAHLLLRHAGMKPIRPAPPPDPRLRRLDEFMRAYLARRLTLDKMARLG
jgi:hypothetical protein